MRVKPSLAVGLLLFVGYAVVVDVVWKIAGVNYDTIGDSVENVRAAIPLAVGVGAVYLIVVTSRLGWWKPAMREAHRAGHAWMWVIPALLAIGVVGNLATTKWGEIDQIGPYVFWLALGCAFVGFSEELVTRGLLIVGARGTLHEGWVWFVSSLCFGLLHVPNALFGQGGRETAQQVVFAFLAGTAYYVTRRISGALVITMVLHGTWDFSVFIQAHSVDHLTDKGIAPGGLVFYLVIVLSLISVWRILHTDGDVIEPGTDQLQPFDAVPA